MKKPSTSAGATTEPKDKIKNFRFSVLELELLEKIAKVKFMPTPTAALRALIMEEATRQGLYKVQP